jgi:hypothetical protein
MKVDGAGAVAVSTLKASVVGAAETIKQNPGTLLSSGLRFASE